MEGDVSPYRNRFKDLDPGNGKNKKGKNKRQRLEETEAMLNNDAIDDRHLPRYLIATALPEADNTEPKPLSSYNVFQIGRGLDYISTEYSDVTEMRNGDLMIKTKDLNTAQKFIKAKYIDMVPVKITFHNNLNSTLGRIFSRRILKMTQEELSAGVVGIKNANVTDIKHILKRDGKDFVPTGAAIVTFNCLTRPQKISIGWEKCTVSEHIMNPMRCVNCQKLGHTKNRCKNISLCGECGNTNPPHEQCPRKFCVNCNNDTHTSYSSLCPTFVKHKSVNKIKADRRCTVREAWKVFNDNPSIHTIQTFQKKMTFSDAVRGVQISENQSVQSNLPEGKSADNNKNINPALTAVEVKIITNNQKANDQLSSTSERNNYSTNDNLQRNKNSDREEETTNQTNQSKKETNIKENLKETQISTNPIINKHQNRNDEQPTTSNNRPIGEEIDLTTSNTLEMKTPPRPNTNSDDQNDDYINQLYKKYTNLDVLITPETLKRTMPKSQDK